MSVPNTNAIDPEKWGVSFSLKQCRNMGIDPKDCLRWLLDQGWRRFRVMSYWNEHEKEQGSYDFRELDWQIRMVEKTGGSVTLCLGVKQPRWPEYHWPKWAQDISGEARAAALLEYIDVTVKHVRKYKNIMSYQLENEALLSNFGELIDIDNDRLKREYEHIQLLDPERPIAMSTSNGWGVPLIGPIPDMVGFSVYTVMYQKGAYHQTIQRPWLHRFRKRLIWLIWRKPVFIHELQCEPWGPEGIWKMSREEQAKSMDVARIRQNIAWAKSINAYPIDLWGSEWWYWRYQQDGKANKAIWDAVKKSLK
ncbi:MAG: hypothetical protein QG629_178 [Patescibacteria group bacterium]|nr:hypothetical protein [Candidatus Saccharibacteria bacterium]MDQ5963096.1 hypothetical protein [Patescibacteria group bacterium]